MLSKCCTQYVSKSGSLSCGHMIGKGQSSSQFPKGAVLKNIQTIRQLYSSPMLVSSVQFSSVTQSCPTLCDPTDCSTPGFLVYHQLPELAQTHIHSVMPSNHLILCHPLSPPAFNLSQHQGVFQWVSSSHQVAKVLEFQLQHQSSNEHSGLISFRMDWLDLLAVQGTLKSLLQHHSSKASNFNTQLSLQSNSHIHTWLLEKP